LVPFHALCMVPFATLAWYRLQRYAWYRFSAIGSELKKGSRTRDYQGSMFWLKEARIISMCLATTEPSVGLAMNEDNVRYKLYACDTGLLLSHAFNEDTRGLNELYKKLMTQKMADYLFGFY